MDREVRVTGTGRISRGLSHQISRRRVRTDFWIFGAADTVAIEPSDAESLGIWAACDPCMATEHPVRGKCCFRFSGLDIMPGISSWLATMNKAKWKMLPSRGSVYADSSPMFVEIPFQLQLRPKMVGHAPQRPERRSRQEEQLRPDIKREF
ncbi:hypothetical protein E4U21_002157 [Claviceps maximensis]|nr:hypothetical protein E4U21_002157 [Claviceps maximensis]